jgi:endonuclease YncB( thermonuclease family)
MARMLICPVIIMLGLWIGAVSSAPIIPDEVRVLDGDTIRVRQQRPDVRLVGFNAPETRRAICEAERELGDKATRRLRDLVQSSKLDFEFVACACPARRNAILQLRKALRHAQSQWARRWPNLDS